MLSDLENWVRLRKFIYIPIGNRSLKFGNLRRRFVKITTAFSNRSSFKLFLAHIWKIFSCKFELNPKLRCNKNCVRPLNEYWNILATVPEISSRWDQHQSVFKWCTCWCMIVMCFCWHEIIQKSWHRKHICSLLLKSQRLVWWFPVYILSNDKNDDAGVRLD